MTSVVNFSIRAITDSDRTWVSEFVKQQWGAEIIVAHGIVYRPDTLAGFIAMHADKISGLITYCTNGDSCEIVTLDSLQPGNGIGTALIDAAKKQAQQSNCRRLFLITPNDNLNALRFYQKRGFVLVAVHRNALEQSRKIKPQIPLIGNDGIPLRDEIELEMKI
ncbi:MAG: GNAT family N-acetyltransferase [Chloroflexi bacterium]|nr:GNAT family N-acetyltransferase [Chloroflexota bacterium]